MVDATSLILRALEQAEEIRPAGAQSLLALATRAVSPRARLSIESITTTLGLHASVVVAIAVTADLAGDSDSRRELGLALFSRLRLRSRPAELGDRDRLSLAAWCVERLSPAAEVLGPVLDETLALCRAHLAGHELDPIALDDLAARATALQASPVVGIGAGSSGLKEKLGLSDEERFRRHAGQALRALIQGLRERGQSEQICRTIAGELARALEAGLGFPAAAGFTLELAAMVDETAREIGPAHN